MVRRGSTVRVRQKGFTKGQQMAFFLGRRALDLRRVGHRSVPKTCPHQLAVSWFLVLTDASEAIEHLHEEVRPQGRARSKSTNEFHSLARLIVLVSRA